MIEIAISGGRDEMPASCHVIEVRNDFRFSTLTNEDVLANETALGNFDPDSQLMNSQMSDNPTQAIYPSGQYNAEHPQHSHSGNRQ